MSPMDYWQEAISDSLDENGVVVTADQLKAIAYDIKLSHENYGMAFYEPTENIHLSEIKLLKNQLKDEKAKTVCKACSGDGSVISYGPSYTAVSTCDACCGHGRC